MLYAMKYIVLVGLSLVQSLYIPLTRLLTVHAATFSHLSTDTYP